MDVQDSLSCPFCGFKDSNEYSMLLHVELSHSEDGESPFAVTSAVEAHRQVEVKQETATQRSPTPKPLASEISIEYVECPYHCGERIPAAELQFHTDFHLAEDMALEEASPVSGAESPHRGCNDHDAVEVLSHSFDTSIPAALRRDEVFPCPSGTSIGSTIGKRRRTLSLRELFFGPAPQKAIDSKPVEGAENRIKRLGRAELGPYAHEKRMPTWLQRMLEEGAKVTIYNKIGPSGTLVRVEAIANETPGLIQVLARLSLQDKKVARAFYCSPQVRHVAKMKNEGGFCGYRNIQMLVSYIRDARAPGVEHFIGRLPSIIKLQDMIERAWDKGYNAAARIETGGIRLTRKYIGTPEAQALLQSLDISCETMAFTSTLASKAYVLLLQSIFGYFDNETDDTHKIVITGKAPIYFQHRGHSMTIVGVEVQHDGKANLVVFDPMFNPSPPVKRLIDSPHFYCRNPAGLLKAHRRGESYLSKYGEFEILKVRSCSDGPPST